MTCPIKTYGWRHSPGKFSRPRWAGTKSRLDDVRPITPWIFPWWWADLYRVDCHTNSTTTTQQQTYHMKPILDTISFRSKSLKVVESISTLSTTTYLPGAFWSNVRASTKGCGNHSAHFAVFRNNQFDGSLPASTFNTPKLFECCILITIELKATFRTIMVSHLYWGISFWTVTCFQEHFWSRTQPTGDSDRVRCRQQYAIWHYAPVHSPASCGRCWYYPGGSLVGLWPYRQSTSRVWPSWLLYPILSLQWWR